VDDLCDWHKMCAVIANEEPWWAGTKIGYHAVTWGFVVGEIVRRTSGQPISHVLREEVAGPLGVADELFFAKAESQQNRLAVLEDAEPDPEMAEMMAAMPADSPIFKVGPAECTTAPMATAPMSEAPTSLLAAL
jgi:CubicO group peptidase (beta-lactamase class C family)